MNEGLGEAIKRVIRELKSFGGGEDDANNAIAELKESWAQHEKLLIRIYSKIPEIDSALSVLESALKESAKQGDSSSEIKGFVAALTHGMRIELRQIREEIDREV